MAAAMRLQGMTNAYVYIAFVFHLRRIFLFFYIRSVYEEVKKNEISLGLALELFVVCAEAISNV